MIKSVYHDGNAISNAWINFAARIQYYPKVSILARSMRQHKKVGDLHAHATASKIYLKPTLTKQTIVEP